ncbi:hypothetical protein AOC36_02090 [Erysipelothrix larvae]|uniref:Polymer-forming cytoskeletal protein n=1 Tax=Erysipelothrix larvae TaxID=1514105 RepID=A0A0X8GYM4_9FIRM|nr:polymer-forming cytoskeletal protein [Erysipelothrix larvae]AMC92816.1 hypothetical protein AOC36_02090 [Erysipelothrix larvae]
MENTLNYSSISRHSLIEGTVDCDHILNVYGKVYGNIFSKKLVLNNAIVYGDINVEENIEIINSHVYGSITAKTVTFSGVCSGDIHASRLEFLEDMCLVYGNIFVDSWRVRPDTKLRLKGKLAVSGIVRHFAWDQDVLSKDTLGRDKSIGTRVKETVQDIAITILNDREEVQDVSKPILTEAKEVEAIAVEPVLEVDITTLQKEIMRDVSAALDHADALEEKAASNDPALSDKKRYNFLSNLAIVLIILITALLLYLVSQGII